MTEALRPLVRGRGPRRGWTSSSPPARRAPIPSDPFFVAIDRLGGRVVRHGVPAHPGSMLWLARIGRTDVLGLPTCGAYSKATAADLLLPRLLSGERASAATVARLGRRRDPHPLDALPLPGLRPGARRPRGLTRDQ